MKRRTKAFVAATVAAVAIGAGATAAATHDDSEQPITGTNLEKASAAALAHTGEGKVTETEVGDEESLYEVEVTLDDGTQVDVQLDAAFNVVGSSADVESGDDGD